MQNSIAKYPSKKSASSKCNSYFLCLWYNLFYNTNIRLVYIDRQSDDTTIDLLAWCGSIGSALKFLTNHN